MPKRFEHITYLGDKKDCDDHVRKTDRGQWCTCPFVLCTGAQECTQDFLGDSAFCRLMHGNIDYTKDLTRNDCACKYMKK